MVHTFGNTLLLLEGEGRLHSLRHILTTLLDDIVNPWLCTEDGLDYQGIAVGDVTQLISQSQ